MQRLIAVAFWPQPLLHFLNRELSRSREEICDNHVLRFAEKVGYGETLLKLTEHACPDFSLGLLGGPVRNKQQRRSSCYAHWSGRRVSLPIDMLGGHVAPTNRHDSVVRFFPRILPAPSWSDAARLAINPAFCSIQTPFPPGRNIPGTGWNC